MQTASEALRADLFLQVVKTRAERPRLEDRTFGDEVIEAKYLRATARTATERLGWDEYLRTVAMICISRGVA